MDPLTRPSFGKVNKSVTDVSAMFPDMLVIAFHFSQLKVLLFSGPYVGLTLHVVYIYLLIEVTQVSSRKSKIAMSFWLARLM